MLTSKERAELRAKANSIDTTLIVGKGGVKGICLCAQLGALLTCQHNLPP